MPLAFIEMIYLRLYRYIGREAKCYRDVPSIQIMI